MLRVRICLQRFCQGINHQMILSILAVACGAWGND
jgi:hypothetical protein